MREETPFSATLDNGKRVFIPLEGYEHVRLGYAVTTHKGQGATVENAFVLLGGPMQDRELSYVQMSRARGETHLYTHRPMSGDVFTGVAEQMEISRQKELASDLVERSQTQEMSL